VSPSFGVDQRLEEVKHRGVGVTMAEPLHERLEQLSDLMYEAGLQRPSKRRLLAALVLSSPTDPKALDELVRKYDGAVVGDAILHTELLGTVVEFPSRRSGPRPKPSA
jgi:hypothetical protein